MPWFTESDTAADPLPIQQVTLRQGDRLSSFAATIEDEYGSPLNLTNATCFLTLRPLTPTQLGPMVENAPLTIETPATAGRVSYDWQASETWGAVPGGYDIQVEVVYSSNLGRLVVPSADQASTVNLRSSVLSDYFYMDPSGRIMSGPDGFLVIDPDGPIPDEVIALEAVPMLTDAGNYVLTPVVELLLTEGGESLLTEDGEGLLL